MKRQEKIYETKNRTKIYYYFEEQDKIRYKEIMRNQHIKARQLAVFMNCTESYISKILKGERPILDTNLMKLNLLLHINERVR